MNISKYYITLVLIMVGQFLKAQPDYLSFNIPDEIAQKYCFLYGLGIQHDKNYHPLSINTGDMGEFLSMYYLYLNENCKEVDTFKFINGEIGISGDLNAKVNIGFWGCNPKNYYPDYQLLVKPKKNNRKYSTIWILKQLIKEELLLNLYNDSISDYKILAVDVSDKYSAVNLFMNKEGVNPHSRNVYVIFGPSSQPEDYIIYRKYSDRCDLYQFDKDSNLVSRSVNKKQDTGKSSLMRDEVFLDLCYQDGSPLSNDDLKKITVSIYYSKSKKPFKQYDNTQLLRNLSSNSEYKLKIKHPELTTDKLIDISGSDLGKGKRIILKPKKVVVYFNYKVKQAYNHTLTFNSSTIEEKYNKSELPFDFHLPDSLSEYWEIAGNNRIIISKETNIYKIPFQRKTVKKEFKIFLKGDVVGELMFNVKAFNRDQSKKRLVKTTDSGEIVLFYDFPQNPHKGDAINIEITKPYGYNISMSGMDPLLDWENEKFMLELSRHQDCKLWLNKLPALSVFYVDVSNPDDKLRYLKILENKLDSLIHQLGRFVVFVSSGGSNGHVFTSKDRINDILFYIKQLNTTLPVAEEDKKQIVKIIPANRCDIELLFMISQPLYDLSSDKIINKLIIDAFNLYRYENLYDLEHILRAANDRERYVNLKIYTSNEKFKKHGEFHQLNIK